MKIRALSILFLLVAIGLVCWSIADRAEYWRARKWPTVKVLSSEPVLMGMVGSNPARQATHEVEHVKYTYEYDGQVYGGTAAIEHRKAGAYTIVHVNPENPAESFIPTGFPKSSIIMSGIAAALFGLAITMWKNADDWNF